eukprot:scpid92181/ scgid28522/ 
MRRRRRQSTKPKVKAIPISQKLDTRITLRPSVPGAYQNQYSATYCGSQPADSLECPIRQGEQPLTDDSAKCVPPGRLYYASNDLNIPAANAEGDSVPQQIQTTIPSPTQPQTTESSKIQSQLLATGRRHNSSQTNNSLPDALPGSRDHASSYSHDSEMHSAAKTGLYKQPHHEGRAHGATVLIREGDVIDSLCTYISPEDQEQKPIGAVPHVIAPSGVSASCPQGEGRTRGWSEVDFVACPSLSFLENPPSRPPSGSALNGMAVEHLPLSFLDNPPS